jgi:ketosteroid isomerase-like protein
MSQDNVEFVQQTWAEFAETGEPAWAALAEDVEIHDHDVPDGSVYSGWAGAARWMENWDSAWEDYRMETEEFIDAGDQVVVVIQMTAIARGGMKLDRSDALVYTLRNGRIVRLDYFNNKSEALKAAGLSE